MPTLETLPPLARITLRLLALGATPRTRTWLVEQLAALTVRNEAGRRVTQDDVRQAAETLKQEGWALDSPLRGQGYLIVDPRRWPLAYADLLQHHTAAELRHLLWQESGMGPPTPERRHLRVFTSRDAGISQIRLELFLGSGPEQLADLQRCVGWSGDWDELHETALLDVVEPQLFDRLHPFLQGQTLTRALACVNANWQHCAGFDTDTLIRTTLQWLHTHGRPGESGPALLLGSLLAELLIQIGDHPALPECLGVLKRQEPEMAIMASVLEAVESAFQGLWAQAHPALDDGIPALRKRTGQRKGLLPPSVATPLVLAHLAEGSSGRLLQALRLCRAEGGKAQGEPDNAWAVMALAIQMRLGEIPRDPLRFRPLSAPPRVFLLDWWRWLMRAWLAEREDQDQLALRLRPADEAAYSVLHTHLQSLGLQRPAAQLEAAHAILHQKTPAIAFFVPPPQEGWQVALRALAAIGSGEGDGPVNKTPAANASRLWWVLTVDTQGLVQALRPLEQKMGLRGWGKPKEVPLARLAKGEGLGPQDAAVTRAIQAVPFERRHRIDLVAALPALLGHPHLAFADAPETAVQLMEGSPELEVLEHGEHLIVRLSPPPALDDPDPLDFQDEEDTPLNFNRPPTQAERKEREALRHLRVMRDEPQRARLVRFTPAQKRVAQLVGLGLTVPRAASAQLQAVLTALGGQFQIQADQLQASREVPCDSRLRAELTPGTAVGPDGLTLRLVVAPLGAQGPRLTPGSGRVRLIATVDGETLGVQRDPGAEREHVNTVMEACPMLGPLPPARHADQVVPALWSIESPEDALALVERLHSLNAVAALDWPKGKPIRVETAGMAQLSAKVHSGTEWLALDGQLQVQEGLVLSLRRLLDWSGANTSRFMPLGEGRYLALTEELRSRLDELNAVGEAAAGDGAPGRWGSSGGALRMPVVAAGWLAATLEGAQLSTDGAWRDRLDTLVRAQNWQPHLPNTLQAELRPYQLEGYRWLMRLAEAGLGAVLADDMGLGKTLQAIAVMLERAAGGAALVVAPTSLMGNWASELRRFAPTLTVQALAEGDREALIEQAGPADVLLISYQLLWLHGAALAQRRWHTLVLDEAQSIKNAAAKRSQAAFDLQADFRMALSGTPIENRLAELWAIMRVCNPGLLGTPAQFNSRFAGPIERDRQAAPRRILRRLISPFVLRRTKAQVLDDLPPRTELILRVQGNETEVAHYEALRRQAVAESHEALSGRAVGQAHFNILAQLTKLRRAACDPRLVTPDLQQVGAKVQAFGELAAELVANGHKALVFSQFVDFLGLLRQPLDAAGIPYQYLDGSTPSAERSTRVAAFQAGQGDLFLISLKAGGFGLNLTAADYVVIADPWWNPAAEDQASGRAHRIGQQRPVTVYRMVNAGTLEERIMALHDSKRELSDSVLAADGQAADLGPMKADELLELMLPATRAPQTGD